MDVDVKFWKEGGEPLLPEDRATAYLGLANRPNPKGALRWLMRTRKLAYVRLAKGIYGFRKTDLDAFIEDHRVAAAGSAQEKTQKIGPAT